MHRQILQTFSPKNKSGDPYGSQRDSVCIDKAPGEIWEDWESFTICEQAPDEREKNKNATSKASLVWWDFSLFRPLSAISAHLFFSSPYNTIESLFTG